MQSAEWVCQYRLRLLKRGDPLGNVLLSPAPSWYFNHAPLFQGYTIAMVNGKFLQLSAALICALMLLFQSVHYIIIIFIACLNFLFLFLHLLHIKSLTMSKACWGLIFR
jgi:hypothetical protein